MYLHRILSYRKEIKDYHHTVSLYIWQQAQIVLSVLEYYPLIFSHLTQPLLNVYYVLYKDLWIVLFSLYNAKHYKKSFTTYFCQAAYDQKMNKKCSSKSSKEVVFKTYSNHYCVQTKFLYWAKFVFRVTKLQLLAGLIIPVNQVISW